MTTRPPQSFRQPLRTTGPWAAWFRGGYRVLGLFAGPLEGLALRQGFGNLIVLRVPGRRSGRERHLPLGLLTVGDGWYLGHPSGDAAWTLNLRAASSATIERAGMPPIVVRPVVLEPGAEREAAVRAAFRQHPFPGNLAYRVAGRHVRATGVFFRLDPPSGRDAEPPAYDAEPPAKDAEPPAGAAPTR